MGGFLRQATASQVRAIGPFVDSTDFQTAETGLTIANTDIKLIVNGGASANKNSGGGTHRANGVYGLTFDAIDTATVGEIEVSVVVAGALPVFDTYHVVEEVVYDALFAAAAVGYQVPIWAAAGSTVNLSATTVKTATDVETDTQDIQSRLPAALVSGRIDASIGAVASGVIAAASFAANALDAVWSTATRLLTAGTNIVLAKGVGVTGLNDLSAAQVNTEADTALADVGLTSTITGRVDAAISTRATPAQVNTEVDTALADYDGPTHAEMTAELATADDATLSAIGALNNLSQANVRTAVGLASANLDTQLAAIPATKLTQHAAAVLAVIVGAGSTLTEVVLNATTGIEGGAPSSVNDFYNGAAIIFTSGALAGQRTSITDYDGATKTLTVVALTGAPASGVTGVIV